MFKFFNKEKFPVKLFVAASLLNLVFFTFIFVVLKESFSAEKKSRLFLNENFKQDDPYITSVPSLKDILRGPMITEDDPMSGSMKSKVFIVSFSDYECEFCQKQEETIKNILQEYGDKVSLVWKDYPENDVRSYSWQAAVAARCANEQGKFWPYHDLLYQNIGSAKASQDYFIDLAGQINLNKSGFKKCLSDPKIEKLIKNNISEAQALDIYGVPFVYVNDQEIMGAVEEKDLKKIIDSELGKNL